MRAIGARRIARGCEEYLAKHSRRIENRRAVVVASCGGYPYDINLIQAHKSLEMAAQACTIGGTIVLLAECRDGLGHPGFMKWFEAQDSRALAARLREGYEVNGQTAWSLLTKAERFQIHLISNLPDDEVRGLRMTPTRSLTDVLKGLDSDVQGFVMPQGAAVLPLPGQE